MCIRDSGCIDHGDLYDSLFYGFQCQKRKEKAKDLQKPEFSDALDSSHALYDYFSE